MSGTTVHEELERFRRDYIPLFLAYLTRRDEAGRRAAYELGRRAMDDTIGLLEVARIHHEVSLEVMRTAKDAEGALEVARAAAEFLLEVLAPLEMAQRGFMDVHVRGNRPDTPRRTPPPSSAS